MTGPASGSRIRRAVVAAAWLLTLAGSLALVVEVAGSSALPGFGSGVWWIGLLAGVAALYTSMGALIEARRPGNRVGLLMVSCGPLLLLTFGGFVVGGVRGGAYGPDDAAGGLAAWVGSMALGPALFVAVPLLATLFPDGGLPGPRWRWPVVLVAAIILLSDLLFAFQPGPIQSTLPNNPFGITNAEWLTGLEPVAGTGFLLGFLGGAALGVAAVTARFRRSRGHEREQMKWFLASFVAVALFAPLSTFDGSPSASVFDVGLIVSIGFVPISVGIAVTRYRLYDIDTIINRALVYGLLTAILAGFSTAAISLAQRASAGVLGQGSDTVIVLTTLLVVAAFNPLKVRLQALVDRRFKEARDPASVLATMAAQLEAAPWQADPDRTVRRLLEAAIGAFEGTGGRARVTDGNGRVWTSSTGLAGQGHEVLIEASAPPARIELRIEGRRADLPLANEQRRSIVESLGRVLREIVPAAGSAPQTDPASEAATALVRSRILEDGWPSREADAPAAP